MPDYLVETYETSGAGRLPPEQLGRVRRLRTLHVPGDEVSLHVFTAPSRDAVRKELDRISFPYERIVEAVTREKEKEEQ